MDILSAPRRGAFQRVAVATLLLVVTGHGPAGLDAQSGGSSTEIPDLSQIWARRGRVGEDGPVRLTARAIGFREMFDEVLAPRYDCRPATAPVIIRDPYNFRIEQQPDRVLLIYEKDDVVRTVWLEGHGHPTPGPADFSMQGHSVGRYEGDSLEIETTKFDFDPNGHVNSGNVASSTLKKVTERYRRIGDRLRVEAIVEDPLILLEPYTFTYEWDRTPIELVPYDCVPEEARFPAQFFPSKYQDPDWVRLPQGDSQ